MTYRHSLAQRLAAILARGGRGAGLSLILAGGLAGCRHKTTPVVVLQVAHAPIELEASPEPENPPMIASEAAPELVPPPPPPTPAPVKKAARKKAAPVPPKEVPPPVQVASLTEPAAAAIGALSSGGDSMAQSQQEARELMASILRRIAALPAATADTQKDHVRQVRHFLDQAQQALDSGDAEGARNLATKAKLLMDDLEKK